MISAVWLVLSCVAWQLVFAEDVCEVVNPQALYCYCNEERSSASCWVFSTSSPNSREWDIFRSQPSLKELNITLRHDGQMAFVPTKIFEFLKSLEKLYIQQANIAEIPSLTFVGLSELSVLKLDSNIIKTLQPQAFLNLSLLREVHLNKNQLEVLPENSFIGCANISELYLSGNIISRLDDESLANLRKLRVLDLSFNKLSDFNNLPFKGLNRLERMNLSNNILETVRTQLFADLTSLETLDLSHNRIKFIQPNALHSLTKLKDLKLYDNKLVTLSDDLFKSAVGLHHLDLRQNVLKYVTNKPIAPFLPNLENGKLQLLLDDNLLACDCHLKWILTLLEKSPSLGNVTCYYYQGEMSSFDKEISVRSLSADKLTCSEKGPSIGTEECPQPLSSGSRHLSLDTVVVVITVYSFLNTIISV